MRSEHLNQSCASEKLVKLINSFCILFLNWHEIEKKNPNCLIYQNTGCFALENRVIARLFWELANLQFTKHQTQ